MSLPPDISPRIAIACGGTGGHLFPGLAVADQLQKRGCSITLLISPKEVDQQAVRSADGMHRLTLPAVALQNGNYLRFARSFWQSWRAAKKAFRDRPPQAVIAMGGFTSAPPVLAGKTLGAKTFLHESNIVPGRANRFLARFVDEVFVGFSDAATRLRSGKISVTGTPVRAQFQSKAGLPASAAGCRNALGLDPGLQTVLVMGGSQGASGLNQIILSALPLLSDKNWQWLHLAGPNDLERVGSAYAARNLKAAVKPFLAGMETALGAATACVSRAGASSLAEIAAMRLPALLVPFPAAADNHQLFNALAFEESGAALVLEQKNARPEKVASLITRLVTDETARTKMQSALSQRHSPDAAAQIAGTILEGAIRARKPEGPAQSLNCDCAHAHGRA